MSAYQHLPNAIAEVSVHAVGIANRNDGDT